MQVHEGKPISTGPVSAAIEASVVAAETATSIELLPPTRREQNLHLIWRARIREICGAEVAGVVSSSAWKIFREDDEPEPLATDVLDLESEVVTPTQEESYLHETWIMILRQAGASGSKIKKIGSQVWGAFQPDNQLRPKLNNSCDFHIAERIYKENLCGNIILPDSLLAATVEN
jgi:hypothetical protein